MPTLDNFIPKPKKEDMIQFGFSISPKDMATLQALAKDTKGFYREASVWVDIAQLVEESVARGAKGEFIDKRQSKLHDRFQLFLGPALLFLFLSYLCEFPVTCVARQLRVGTGAQSSEETTGAKAASEGRSSFFEERSSSSSGLLLCLVLTSSLLASPHAHAQTAPEEVTPPSALETLVGQLAVKEKLGAEDYGTLAQESLNFASQPPTEAQDSLGGVIKDGLGAVDRGERSDPEALPWEELRSALLQLQEQEKQRQQQEQQNEQD